MNTIQINTTRSVTPKARIIMLKSLAGKLKRAVEYDEHLRSLIKTPASRRLITMNRRKMIRLAENIYAVVKRPDATP